MLHCSVRGRTVSKMALHRKRLAGRTFTFFTALPLFGNIVTTGCRCEGNDQRPFTPFGVATEIRSPDSTLPVAPLEGSPVPSGAFARVKSQNVNPPTSTIVVGDVEFRAPEGKRIAQYVAADLDGAEGVEVVARVVSGSAAGASPTPNDEPLLLMQAGRPPKTLVSFPAYVPRSDSCSVESQLQVTGPRTVTWDVGARCAEGVLIPRAPHRGLIVVHPTHASPVRLQLRLAEPPRGEVLTVDVDTSDADGDGHDDAELTFRLHLEDAPSREPSAAAKSAPPAEAKLVWLDRAAGMARDHSEPRNSLTALGSLETVRAKGQNTSRQVGSRVQLARRLFAYLCKEGGTYRLTDVDGTAFACGDLSASMDALVTADVTAALTQKHYARAVLAFEQASWFGPGVTRKVSQNLEKALRSAISSRVASSRVLDVQATAPPPGPHYSSLRWVDRTLFIGTPSGVQRYNGSSLEDASDEVDAWSLLAFGPSGQRLSQLAFPCNDPLLVGSSQTNGGTFGTALVTDILSPRPGVCDGRGSPPEIDFRPVAWSQDGLSAYVGPVAVGAAPRFRQPGSPQSNNGNYAITSTRLGLLVQSPTVTEWWDAVPDAGRLADCVIADSGNDAACLSASGRVVALTTTPSR